MRSWHERFSLARDLVVVVNEGCPAFVAHSGVGVLVEDLMKMSARLVITYSPQGPCGVAPHQRARMMLQRVHQSRNGAWNGNIAERDRGVACELIAAGS